MTQKEDARRRLGLVQVYTGDGKGKTTAAFGLAARAAGNGLKVVIIQFLKPDGNYGEQISARRLGIDLVPMGRDHMHGLKTDAETEGELTAEGMRIAADALTSGSYDLVVLDELNNSLRFGLVTPQEVIDILERRSPGTEVVLTGRGAPNEIVEYADLVTEMRLVKHPMDRGIPARRGIEYRRARLFYPSAIIAEQCPSTTASLRR